MPSASSKRIPRAKRVALTAEFIVDVVGAGIRWAWLPVGTARRETAAISKALVKHVHLPAPLVSASVSLCRDADLQALNKQWRGLDKPTNVLSFPAGETASQPADEALFLGDVILAAETIAREADEQGKGRRDHFRHLVAHGLLHLLGYDHETPRQAEEMEDLERLILADLGVADPYADIPPVVEPKRARSSRSRQGMK